MPHHILMTHSEMTTTYQLPGFHGLFLGRTVNHPVHEVQYGPLPYNRASNWTVRPGTYTAREFVREIAVLLESIIVQLGPDPPESPSTRSMLMDGLRSSLSHEGREATLLLEDWKSDNPSEITKQALKIGDTLYGYASEFNNEVPGDPHLTVYSPCEGHKWVPPAGRLLRSSRSSPLLMMLYNEWLHQMTCLRDGLLPFQNFEEIPLILDDTTARGTRPLEEIRRGYVAKIQSGHIGRAEHVEIAKVFTSSNLPSGGYGFQYQHGTVLPESLFSDSRSQLLRYIPTALVDSGKQPVLFDYESDLLVPSNGVDISSLAPSHAPPARLAEAAIMPDGDRRDSFENPEAITQQLKLVGLFESGGSFSVGLGRILGRLALLRRISADDRVRIGGKQPSKEFDASELLAVQGTLRNDKAVPISVRATDQVALLALIGKLETDNIFAEAITGGTFTDLGGFSQFFII